MSQQAADLDTDPTDIDGRRHRLIVILAIAAAILALGVVVNWFSDRSADAELEALRSDLNTTFAGTTSADFEAYAFTIASTIAFTGAADEPDILDVLTTAGGTMPDAARFEGDTLLARYPLDAFSGPHCVRASWTSEGVSFDNGTGAQCTTLSLD